MLLNDVKKLYEAQEQVNENNHELWLNCYMGEAPWIGGENLASLNIPASISSELARLTTIEFKSAIKDEELNPLYQKIVDKARRYTEYGLALGGIVLKPYIEHERLTIDYVTPDMFLILDFSNFDEITHIVFLDRLQKQEGDETIYYTRLEDHNYQLDAEQWEITHRVFQSTKYDKLGDEISIQTVEEWAQLQDALVQTTIPLFAYFKNPQANNLDLSSNEGVSCFSRALSLIQDADEQYNRILWEYQGAELAIDADVTVLKNADELPKGKERLFRNLGRDQKEGFYEVFSPDIRDSALFNGLNKILRRIEFTVGLAYGTLSEVDEVEKSATEVKASKQRSYSTVVDIQKSLQLALETTLQIMALWSGKDYEALEPSFEFDDSLIVDTQTEQAIRLQEVAAGLTKPEAYLAWRYGVTEEEATQMLPHVQAEPTEDEDYE